MTTAEKSTNEPGLKEFSIHRDAKLDPVLGRIDLVAIVIGLLGVCLLGVVALVMAVIELAKLVASLWSDSLDRWLMVTLAVAIVWILARWKRLCVF
ncbi:MAG TPA: hypothetical protein VH251_02590 [Verrucomicrobiae bacterium]|nr:hypothetical protein [Verrucomicrobiae bacterium]